MNKLYILLPVYDRVHLTLKFITALKPQTYKNIQLILIDDGSADGTADQVKKEMPQAVILQGKGDWWWAGSLQQGYHWIRENAEADSYIAIFNDDLVFDADLMEKGVGLLQSNSNSFLLAAAYDQDDHTKLEDCGVIYNFKEDTFVSCDLGRLNEVNCLSTRGLFMHSADFLRTGGFRPHLLPHYYSDYEFTIRAARKHGIQLKCVPELKVYMNTKSTGTAEITFNSLKEFWGKAFSKRYKTNSLYTMRYYLYSFPFPYNLKHWYRTFRQLLLTCLKLMFA